MNKFFIFGFTFLLFLSCEKEVIPAERPDGQAPNTTISAVQNFEFATTQHVKLQVLNGQNFGIIHSIEVYRNYPNEHQLPLAVLLPSMKNRADVPFDLRAVDHGVWLKIHSDYGSQIYPAEVQSNRVNIDLRKYEARILEQFTMGKTESGCTDSLANDDAGAAANSFGFGTRIVSVVDNGSDYTITVRVSQDGCGGPTCKELSHFSVEVDPTNTVSNVSWQVISGGMTGNLEMSLGNNDPFDGFKIDNTSGIGGGNAGEFEITYTLATLQGQRFLAKAGSDYDRIANFGFSDFTCLLNRTTPGLPDSDGDGVPNATDRFPNDPNLAVIIASDTNSFAAEDNWPYAGDYDFNDLVAPYFYRAFVNADGEVMEFRFYYKFLARGAAKKNGFGFSIKVNPGSAVATGCNLTEGYIAESNGIETGSTTELSVVVEDIVNNKLAAFNTISGIAPVYMEYDSVVVSLANGFPQADLASFAPFMILDQTRGKEIREVNHEPSFNMNRVYLGQGLDHSDPSSNRYYQQLDGLPWVLNVPGEFKYPLEQTDINDAYKNFKAWAQSGGNAYADWYDHSDPNNIDDSKIYSY